MRVTLKSREASWGPAAAKSLKSCPTLCDPIDGSPPGSPVPGILQQEHWSGLPFPSPMHERKKWKWSCSIVSDPQWSHGLQLSRLLRPWDFPGKSTGVGCHCLLHHGVLNSPKSKTKCQLKGFHSLVGIHRYYWNIIPNFSIFKSLCFIVVFRCSVMTNSFWHYELHPTRLLCPWNYPGKNIGVGCYVLLQEIFPTSPPAGIKPTSLISPELAGGLFTTSATWEALYVLLTNMKRKGMPLRYAPQITGIKINPQAIIASNLALWHRHTCFALQPLWPLLFWLRPRRKLLRDLYFHTSFSCLTS